MWTWRGLVTFYTVFVIDLASRRVQILGSTAHPEALFMEQVVRTLAMAEHAIVPAPASRVIVSQVGRGMEGYGLDELERVAGARLTAPPHFFDDLLNDAVHLANVVVVLAN